MNLNQITSTIRKQKITSIIATAVGANQNLSKVLITGNDGGGLQIKNIADPTQNQDALTLAYFNSHSSGGVTSVALSLPSIFTVSGSPITTSGTLSASFNSQTQNLFFASPNGSSGTPTFRSIVSADIPTLNQNTTGTSSAWNTGRTLSITGDLAYTSPSFDGTGNVTAAGTLATVNSNVGSFGSSIQSGTFTVNGKGLITAASNVTITPAIGSITGLGTGVATALAINIGTSGSVVVNGGALGTPSSGTLTNATGLPVSSGISGLGTGIATWLATPSSANLASALTDETGTGAVVFAGSPAFTGTPTIGTLGYSDTGILWSFQSSTNSYNQIIVQNTNNGSTASANIILSNDQGTSSTHFTEVGINSSGFTGSGSFNIPGASYFDAVGGDAVFGTTTNNSIHLVVNNSTTDAMTISGAGLYTITSPVKSNTIGGTFTATANNDYHWDFNATITGRASQTSDYVYGTKVDNTLKLGSNNQKLFNFYSTVANFSNNSFTQQVGGSGLFTGVVYINASLNPSIQGRAGIESSINASPANGWLQIEDLYPGIQLISNGNATDRWFIFTGVQTLSSGGGSTDLSFRCNSAGSSGAGDLFSLTKSGFYGFGQNSITQSLTLSSNILQYRHKYTAPSTTATITNYFDFSGQTYTFAGTNQIYNHFNSNLSIAVGSNTGATISGFIHNPTVTNSVSYTNYAFRAQTGSLSGFGTLTPAASIEIEAGITTRGPLRLTAGTDLTSPVNGTFEFDGTTLKFTRSGTTRESILTGIANIVSPTSPNRTIQVVVAGTTYYLAAKTTND